MLAHTIIMGTTGLITSTYHDHHYQFIESMGRARAQLVHNLEVPTQHFPTTFQVKDSSLPKDHPAGNQQCLPWLQAPARLNLVSTAAMTVELNTT
jgi:hypothetical protein